MTGFDHERLDVYQAALEFLPIVDAILAHVPRGRAHLADQLDRASTSIVLNIAEGAGEFAPAEKARFYRMARRSGNESAAILDVLRARGFIADDQVLGGKTALSRIGAMLTRMVLQSLHAAKQQVRNER